MYDVPTCKSHDGSCVLTARANLKREGRASQSRVVPPLLSACMAQRNSTSWGFARGTLATNVLRGQIIGESDRRCAAERERERERWVVGRAKDLRVGSERGREGGGEGQTRTFGGEAFGPEFLRGPTALASTQDIFRLGTVGCP